MNRELEALVTPVVSHRFLTLFLFNKIIPSPIDIFFQKVSGLNREMDVSPHRQGGDNVGEIYLPQHVRHGSLVLERGVMTMTPLTWTFNNVMSEFNASYVNVVVMLLNHKSIPISSWTLTDAMPVKWQMGELDANSNQILINRMELVYRDINWLGTKL